MNTTRHSTPRKRLVREVNLRFFQDDANGEYGLAHADTLDHNGDGFNAFWDGTGIFHDVFEHAHEHSEHFRGSAAMNVGGEMAAMGAFWYFMECLYVPNRIHNSYHSHSTLAIGSTFDMVQEAVEYGYTRFGDRLVCEVPAQAADEESYLEGVIDEYISKVAALEPGKSLHPSERDQLDYCKAYKDSCTRDAIANLHRWGYNEARRIVPHDACNRNSGTCYEFIRFWQNFCKSNPAEDLQALYRGITFRLYRTGEILSWNAQFNPEIGSGLRARLLHSEGLPEHIPVLSEELSYN